jgi:hypothetical protein
MSQVNHTDRIQATNRTAAMRVFTISEGTLRRITELIQLAFGVLNGDGQLVGIPIGRMQGDYRFSFILPLRGEMFRKVGFLN